MKLEGLSQPPFDTTLAGVLAGALGHVGVPRGPATVFGGSGLAFLINIHKELCPSGPYCWDHRGVLHLVGNLGLRPVYLGFFSADSSAEQRAAVEHKIKAALDAGTPCSLLNMEHQLILGYDDARFVTAQPWPSMADFPPATLSFGSWSELGEGVHLSFYIHEPVTPADERKTLVDSLRFAVDLHRRPDRYAETDYGIGPDAYALWMAALAEHGQSHGNWWNATVWSECRRMAAEYLAASQALVPDAGEELAALSDAYAVIADRLASVADRDLPLQRKAPLLAEAAEREAEAVDGIDELLATSF